MRLVATRTIEPGTMLAKPIYTDRRKVLIQKEIKLTKNMLKRLLQLGITYVYIHDEYTKDILVSSPVSDELRIDAVNTIKQSFTRFQKEGFVEGSYIFEQTGKQMSGMVQNLLKEMQGKDEVLSILSDILITDDYVFSHSLNVTIYSLALATELGLPQRKLEEIGLGAMLHDVGKMFIPDEILQKEDKLTDYEFEVIKHHTDEGFNFLRKSQNIPLLVAHCAYQHHERLNGSGYPRGLIQDEIHEYAKIIGIADVFDAVTSNRIYRDAMLPHEGLEVLYAGVGELFDKNMVEAFRKSIAVYPNGLTVELNDGRIGVVSKQNPTVPDRPIIRIIEENGERLDPPYELDLLKQLNFVITSCDTTFPKTRENINNK
ncbi:HD-GYP domain-containing protein [Radiobacillus kanasensis]|uniref:HD-GYP domain-containing protein n=1 Tax=Radiobacillus kanasensis TaxID=2844358 RepID=UPI001E549F1D|nr:HD-GYP domain-containing protein [Radiobacillus kanasensis]UFT98238.1 HD-GYP domain-containing protein [Radiobacillus kanasensis]